MPEWLSIFEKMLKGLFRRISVRVHACASLKLAIEYDSTRDDDSDPSQSSDPSVDD